MIFPLSWPWKRRRSLGQRGEDVAARFLRRQGFRILRRNYRSRLGEVDLIASDGDTLVFVEVKTRATSDHGEPFEAVTLDKQRRLARLALEYLKQNSGLDRRCRFDVVSVVWSGEGTPPEIQHFRAAFEPPGDGQLFA